jgi:Flp pilus assembly protein TadB
MGCMRVSLGISKSRSSNSQSKSRRDTQQAVVEVSAFRIWDLTRSDVQVELRRKRFGKWSKAVVGLVNNVNYLYGTAVFTSLTLVFGVVAITKLAIFGIIVVGARIVTVWVLDDIEGED